MGKAGRDQRALVQRFANSRQWSEMLGYCEEQASVCTPKRKSVLAVISKEFLECRTRLPVRRDHAVVARCKRPAQSAVRVIAAVSAA